MEQYIETPKDTSALEEISYDEPGWLAVHKRKIYWVSAVLAALFIVYLAKAYGAHVT